MACPICTHPERAAVEAALAQGATQRDITKRFGIPKSTLGRARPEHRAHHGPAPEPSPPVSLPTVAQCEQQVAQLHTRLATCQADLASLQAPGAAAHDAYRLAMWREQAVTMRAAHEQLERLERQRQELSALALVLAEGIAAAQSDLEAAKTRRQAAETAHWSTVLEQLEDPFAQYCCQLLRFPHRWPPPTTPAAFLQRFGPMGVSDARKTTLAALRERYPFVEEEPVHG